MSLGDSLMTAAECAQAFTERQMDIEADTLARITLGKCPGDRFLPLLRIDRIVVPVRHRRIARIARSGYVVFLYQIILHGKVLGLLLVERAGILPKAAVIQSE